MAESSFERDCTHLRVKETGVRREEDNKKKRKKKEKGFVRRWKYFLRDALRAIDPRDRLRSRGMTPSPPPLSRPTLFSSSLRISRVVGGAESRMHTRMHSLRDRAIRNYANRRE